MQKYESVLIARQDLGASQVNNIVSDLSEVIKKEGGEVVRVDNWGLKTLAYRIKKNRKGHYVLMNISAPASAIAEYERVMRFNEDIIRYMTLKVDEFCEGLASSEDKEPVEKSSPVALPTFRQRSKENWPAPSNAPATLLFFLSSLIKENRDGSNSFGTCKQIGQNGRQGNR